MNRSILLASAAAAAVPFSPTVAAPAPAPATDQTAPTSATNAQRTAPATKGGAGIVITGRRLDIARDAITPSLGASQYTFDKEALEKQPGGTNLTLNK